MLGKSTLREIKTSLARYLAIFAITALGVGFFAGLKDTKASMLYTADAYLRETNFYDYMILSSYGIDEESVELALATEDVTGAEASKQVDAIVDIGGEREETLKAISLPDKLNMLTVVEGRLPENDNECVMDSYTITGGDYEIGGKVTISENNDDDTLDSFKVKEFTIVGTVNTPIYMDYQRGSTTIGNGTLDTFFFIPEGAFDTDYYTALYLTLEGDEYIFSDEMNDKLDSHEDPMEDLAERITAARRETAMSEAQDKLDEKTAEYEDGLAEYQSEKADAEKELDNAQDEIDSGKSQIKSARKKLNSTISELKSNKMQIADGIKQAEASRESAVAQAVSQAETEAEKQATAAVDAELASQKEQTKSQLDAALAAGQMTEEQYNAQLAAAQAAIDAQRDSAVASAVATAKKQASEKATKAANDAIDSTIADLKSKLAQVEDGLSQAEAGLAELNSKQAELNKAQRTLNSKRAEAEAEFADAEAELEEAKEKIDDAQDEIDEMETGNSYALSRNDNDGYSSFDSNSDILDNIAKIFPVFFFLIAALVCMTTMTRMIDEQRTQIGVLKALGYSNKSILGKYLSYSGSASLLGALFGFFVGIKVFPSVIWHAYTMMYAFTDEIDIVLDRKLGALSVGAAILCAIVATWASISADFKVAPANLIRPKTPKAGKRILLEYITPFWNRLNFLHKVSARNIFRDKKRFVMMVIGVAGCTALLIAAMGIKASISNVAKYQFEEISTYDYQVVFSKDMTDKRQADFTDYMDDETGEGTNDILFLHNGTIDLEFGGKSQEVNCYATKGEDLEGFTDLHAGNEPVEYPGKGEVVIVQKTHSELGVNIGDTVTLREGYREMEATVVGIADNYVWESVFMTPETYENGFGIEPELKTALVNVSPEGDDDEASEDRIREVATAASNYDDTSAVVVSVDMLDKVETMMDSLNSVIFVVILSAALLAFIVLYNLTNISITERTREIATIKVLGFNQLEVSQYVFRENFVLTAIAAVVGIPAGKWLLNYVMANIKVKMMYFAPRIDWWGYLIAVGLTFLFAFMVNLAMQKRLRDISMTESLKSIE